MKSWYNFTDISHVLYVILCCYIKLILFLLLCVGSIMFLVAVLLVCS